MLDALHGCIVTSLKETNRFQVGFSIIHTYNLYKTCHVLKGIFISRLLTYLLGKKQPIPLYVVSRWQMPLSGNLQFFSSST